MRLGLSGQLRCSKYPSSFAYPSHIKEIESPLSYCIFTQKPGHLKQNGYTTTPLTFCKPASKKGKGIGFDS
jgi:hypothetical protein